MRWFALIGALLLGGCGTHHQTAECSRYLAGMKQAFDSYDTDHDGLISREEYRAAINNLIKSAHNRMDDQPSREARQLDNPAVPGRQFDSLDANHDGYIGFDEFTGGICKNGH